MSGAPHGAEQMIAKMPPEVLGFPGLAANWLLGFPGMESGIMEAIEALDRKFGVDAFDEGIHSMHRFYDCMRKGLMAHFVADFENFYEDAVINADMALSDSAKSWHFLKGCSLHAHEVKNILT